MQELLSQLGVDWHLLISQAVNFFLLLLVLWYFVYKPVLKILRERRERIEDGIAKADEADRRLRESDEVMKTKIKEGETEALAILRRTENEAKELEAKLLAEAKRKEAEEFANAAAQAKVREAEARRLIEKEAAAFVRAAIAKTVELAPEAIDDALIARAVEESKKAKPA